MAFINRLGHPESQPGSIVLAGLVDHRVVITDTLQVRDNARKNAYLYIVTDATYDFLSDDLVRNGWNIVAKKFSGTDAAPTVPELQALGVDLLVIDFYAWAVTGALLDLAYSAYQAGISVITTGNDTTWSPGNPIWTGAASAANASLTPISPVGTHPVSQGWSTFGDGDVATYSSGLRATAAVVGQFSNGAPAIFVEQNPSGSGARYVHCQPLSTTPGDAFWNAALSWIELAHEGDIALSSTRDFSDNLGITDSIVPQLQRPVSDTENLSDAGVARNPHGRGVDWMTVSDSISIFLFFDEQFQETPSDTVGITDTFTAVRERFAADTIGVTDELAFVLQFGPLEEIVSIIDFLVFESEEVLSSNMGLTDALETKLNPEVVDSTGLTDANQYTDIIGETTSNLGLTDVIDPVLIVAASFEQNITDTLGLRDHTGARAYVWSVGSGENTLLASYLGAQGWSVVTKHSALDTLPTVQALIDDNVDLFIADYATSGVPSAVLDLAYSAYQAGISVATTGAETTYSAGCPIWTTAWVGPNPDFSPVVKYTPPFQDLEPLTSDFITAEWTDFNDNTTHIAPDFFRDTVEPLAEYQSDWFGDLIAAWAEQNPTRNGARWVHMQSPASIVPDTFWLRAFIWLRQTTLGDIEFSHERTFDDTLGLTDNAIPTAELVSALGITDTLNVESVRVVGDTASLSEQSVNLVINPRPIGTTGWMLTNPGGGGAVTTSYDSSIEAFSSVVTVASSDGHYTFQIGNSLSTWVPVQGGKVYYQRIEAMSSVTDVRDIAIDWFDASGNPVGSATGASFALTQSLWVTLSMTATAPPTAAYAAANIIVRNVAQSIIRPVGSRLALRRAMLVEGQPTNYFDGATDRGTVWSGIANASTSIKTIDISKTSIQEPIESVNLSDVVSLQPGIGLTEAPQLTDFVLTHLERRITDNLGITEVVGPNEDNEESPVDSVELSDVLLIEFIPGLFHTVIRTDDEGLTDEISLAFEYGLRVDDSTGVTDAASTLAIYIRNLLESAGTRDTLSTLREIERQLSDDALAGDTVVFDTELPLSEDVALDDAIELSLGPDVRDDLGLTDVIQVVVNYARLPVDTAWVNDTLSRAAVYVRDLDESTLLTDQTSAHIELSRQDSIALTDADRIYDLDVATYPASDIGITDALVVALELGVFVADSAGTTDATTRAVSFDRSFADQTSIYSTPVSSRGFNVSITDDISVIDLGDASSPSGHHTELVRVEDDLSFTYFKEAFQTDVFNMGDELVVELTIQIHFFSFANMRDAVTVAESDETQHADSIIVTDLVRLSRGPGLEEDTGLTDAVSVSLGVPFIENVTLQDSISIAVALGVSSLASVTDRVYRQLDKSLSETVFVDDGAGNLALNPSLETDDSFWYATIGSTVGTRETSGGYDGSAFYRVTWTAPTSNGGGVLVFQQPVKAGFTYAMAVRVRTSVAKNVYLSAVWENASQAQIGLSSGATTSTQAGEWTYVLMENVQAPAGTVFVKPRVLVSGASSTGDTLDADLLVIQQTQWVNPFEVETSIGYGRAVADDSVLFDAINSVASLNPSDSVGLSETIAVVLAAAQQRTENVLVSDALVRAVGRNRSASDSAGLADSTTIQRARSAAPTETVVVSDTLDIVVGIRRDDEITLEDDATPSLGVSRSHADAVALTDSLTFDVVWGHTNLIRVFDSISIQTGTNRTVNYYDPIPLSDVTQVVTTYPRDPREDVGLVDSIRIDLSLGIRDPLGVTDAAAPTVAFNRSPADSTQVTDSWLRDFSRSLADNITIQDGTDDVTPWARDATSDLGITDDISIVVRYTVPLVESAGLADSQLRETSFTRFFYNLEFVRDTVARGYARSLSDVVGSSDSIVVAEGQGTAYADDLGLSDAISVDLTLGIADSVDTLDDADPVVAFSRLVIDAVPASDALLVEEAEAESVAVFDPVSLSDLIFIEQTMSGAMLAEAVPAGSGHVIMPRALQDVVDVTDVRAFVADYSRQFTNLVVLNDPRTVASTYVRAHEDEIGVTDEVTLDLDDVTDYEDITVYSIKLRTDWDADARESGYDAMASSRYDGSVRVEQMYIRLALREEIEL